MPNSEKPLQRFQIPFILAKKFINDYEAILAYHTIEEQIELTGHLMQALALMNQYERSGDNQNHKKYSEAEHLLSKKYGSKLQPYKDRNFHSYFLLDIILVEKNIVSTEEYNNLSPDQQHLTVTEFEQFVRICEKVLYQQRDYMYLQVAEEPLTLNDNLTLNSNILTDEPDKEITKARQLLAIHYLLKVSFGIEGRSGSEVSGIARFIHLLTGTKFTTIQNSDVYKKYLLMPNYKKGSNLIADLKFIRPYFEALALESVTRLIDEEINRAIKDMTFAEKQKHKKQ